MSTIKNDGNSERVKVERSSDSEFGSNCRKILVFAIYAVRV